MTATKPSAMIPSFRVLILEDHDFQRTIGVQILERCGALEVLEAADGVSALAQITHGGQPVDVLVCDLSMPGMDGLAFLRHLSETGSKSSVILCSALDSSIIRAAEIMAKSYGLHIVGVVDKPLSQAKLMPLLLRHFSRNLATPRPKVELLALKDIQAGIAQQQFLPFFQPKIDIRSGRMVGVEALMRWRHPELGLVPPAAFIPVMEEHRLITPISYTIVGAALAHCRRWRDQGMDISVSVNVSVDSLSDTSLPDRLEAMVVSAGLVPNALVIEITETVAMTDLGRALETLARCRIKGFDLSIDDYGTGFSSMQQLTRLPLSEIKIDQSFVTGASGQTILQALIETSVTIAQRLKLRSVAEGVETRDDWGTVARLGCEIAQGYFIARPMAGEDLDGWYATWLGQHRHAVLALGGV
jgi:EAL domain-containing protein (putative c-di-GMP-specific phosphodiesterase class I)/AmiR/NasT family two-component response regulator